MAAEEGDATTSGPRLWLVLLRAYRAMAEVLEADFAEDGLCLSDFAVLEVLLNGSGEAGGRLPMSAIGEKVQLRNASMTSAIDRMEGRGLVTREGSPCDKRVRMVGLTAEGRRLIGEVYRRHEVQLEWLMEGLSVAERTEMRRGLKRMGLRARAMGQEQARERKVRAGR